MTKSRVSCLLLLILSTGCANMRYKMSRLDEGMTKKEVMRKLGRPDGATKVGNYESLEYNHRLITGWAWDRADYFVILEEGRVRSYGMGEVREGNFNPILLAPFPGTGNTVQPMPPAPPLMPGY